LSGALWKDSPWPLGLGSSEQLFEKAIDAKNARTVSPGPVVSELTPSLSFAAAVPLIPRKKIK